MQIQIRFFLPYNHKDDICIEIWWDQKESHSKRNWTWAGSNQRKLFESLQDLIKFLDNAVIQKHKFI